MSEGRVLNLRPFQAGTSGNPGGMTSATAEARAFAKEKSPAAIRGLWDLAENSKDERVRLIAFDKILDRSLGKPKEIREDENLGLQKRLEYKAILAACSSDEIKTLMALFSRLRQVQAAADADPVDVTSDDPTPEEDA